MLSPFTTKQIYIAAELSNSAYLLNPRTSVESLGMKFIAQTNNEHCQATICQWEDYDVIAFRGTQVFPTFSFDELFDDVDLIPKDIGGGKLVYLGFWNPMIDLWNNTISKLPFTKPKKLITGHSLGGVRAQLFKYIWKDADVISFGAPRGANDVFWNDVYKDSFLTRVVHARDFAPNWPPLGMGTHPDTKMFWLTDNTLDYTETRPYNFLDLNISDHSIVNGYLKSLKALNF